jgi:hypothetical protein
MQAGFDKAQEALINRGEGDAPNVGGAPRADHDQHASYNRHIKLTLGIYAVIPNIVIISSSSIHVRRGSL